METPTPSAQGRTSSDPSPGEPIAAPPTVPMHADATSKSTPRPATHPNATASASNALLPSFDSGNANFHYHIRAPSTGLTLQTDFLARHAPQEPSTLEANAGDARPAASAPIAIQDQSYLRTARSSHSIGSAFSPSSLLSSPMLNALGDITPLPSPLVMSDSPGPWQRGGRPRSGSRDDFYFSPRRDTLSPSPSLKKKGYERLKEAAAATHVQQTDDAARERNRSISDYTPDPLQNPRPRHVTIGNTAFEMDAGTQQFLHRELYLAAKRGLIANKGLAALPTPPASNASTKSVTDTEEDEFPEDVQNKYIVVRQGPEKTKSRWRQVRQLGQGTFSTVYLATSERTKAADPLNETTLDPRKLVAIKMVEHGPAGGADEERVELSLKREVEMLQSVSHPSLVHLQAFDHNDDQALIVLTYCPGGDLFDVASDHRDTLTADLVQRVFAEMVSAVRYLHSQLIVHRDIKLESTASSLLRHAPAVCTSKVT
jgi:protein-serine/threonine kinase